MYFLTEWFRILLLTGAALTVIAWRMSSDDWHQVACKLSEEPRVILDAGQQDVLREMMRRTNKAVLAENVKACYCEGVHAADVIFSQIVARR
jgi:malonyl CoA-acyl carrier protein transacylase